MKITAKLLKSLADPTVSAASASPGKDYSIFDDDIPGFGVRVYPSGKRAFIFMYRHGGLQKKLTLGRYPAITVDQARRMAAEKALILASGIDPARSGEAITVGAFCAKYLERWAKPRKKTWRCDERRINRVILPRWGSKRLETIRRADVERLIVELGRTAPIEANRILSLLLKIFNLAVQWGAVPNGFVNPAQRVEKHRERKRERWLTPAEIPRFLRAVAEEPDIYVRAGIILYLFTGLRKLELLHRRWSDLDLDRRVLRLEDTKAGRAFELPLSEAAVEVFCALPRLSPWIFPGKGDKPVQDFYRKAWARIRARAGMPDLTIHSLRHTFASWLASSGESMRIIGGALNQSTASITERYAHLGDDPLRQAVERHGKRLPGALEIVNPRKKEEAI
ncbi:MAG: tyrosine-type recombinase/integrase [Candidatus Omnitrophota bacterium]